MGSMYEELSLKTESDVEQKLIYKLLTMSPPNGLGFSESDIRTKTDIRKLKIDKGTKGKLYYPDYAIIVNGLPIVIIEAKTPGESLDEAQREARLYATEINASYPRNINPCEIVIATDGNSLSVCFWDNETPEIVLDRSEFDPLNAGFSHLLDIASKKPLIARTEKILKSVKSSAIYFKPTSMLGGKTIANETVGENSFGANVSIEYKYLFNPDTLADRASIAHNAYVTSIRKQSHIAPIDKIIRAALPTSSQARLIEDTSTAKEIIEQVYDFDKIKNEICLLIGGVGSGKSTFTDYIRLEALPKPLVESTIWVNINLNKAPLNRSRIYDWIIKQGIDLLRASNSKLDFDSIEMLKKVYSREIGRVERGKAALYPKDSEKYADVIFNEIDRLQSDMTATLDGMINYLCTGGDKLLIVVLDNCDKRNRDDQLLMFEVASWLKETFPCMVFLPLRDTTYDQYRDEPPLDTVIKDLVFRIDPPLLEKVIYKRLNYALRVIQNQKSKFIYTLPNNMRVECARSEVATYIQSVISSLFQDTFFKRIITGLAGRNIRKGLEILLDFCKSGHIGEDELLKARQSNGGHKLPNYLIAKILLKSKRKYYSDNESHIKNLFSSNNEDSLPNPFIRIAMLNWLRSSAREYGPNRTKGFHKISTLISHLQGSGHAADRAFFEIAEMIKAGCILSEAQSHEITEEDLIAISPAGLIHLDLLRNIDYISTVAEDVYFRENQPARKIADNLIGKGPFKIDSRQTTLSNSSTLINYLANYHEKFFVGPAKVLTDEHTQDLLDLTGLVDYVKRTSENDETFTKLNKLESEYPEGNEVDALIVSVQNYGVFVEFGLEGQGLVKKPNHTSKESNLFNNFEEGMWIRVVIGKYSHQHKRFALTLA
ncbi:type I restriction endonuclease [Pseudomonas sp. VE 196-7]|uniref:type I restriction endonuclease n=1 Tax=Pseudomonas sp. VE 196-7 TaxID=2956726 RepID=UPI0021D4DE97|nr:type I restriction endonuclease [Pseudomonas sp. VE 196-7]MCU7217562.1 type I restriction endonuclease [Pseudomonas sp. VE 196-7]